MFVLKIGLKIASIVIYLLTIAAAFGGYVDPHIWALPAVMTLALPYLAMASAFATICWLICKSWVIGGVGAATILLCASPLQPVFPLATTSKEKKGQRTFTLITYNISHGDDLHDSRSVNNRTLRWIIEQDADIVVLQELFDFSSKEIPYFSQALKDSLFRAYPYWGGDKSTDRKVLSKFDVTTRYDLMEPYHRGVNGFDVFTIDIYGHKLNIIDTHLTSYPLTHDERNVLTDIAGLKDTGQGVDMLKTTVKEKLSETFRKRAELAVEIRDLISHTPDPLIVCGDFNDVPSSWTYRIMRGEDLHDAYAETGFGHLITFNTHLFYFHIDQILYRGNLKALSVVKGDIKTSDHYPLIARFAFTAPPEP